MSIVDAGEKQLEVIVDDTQLSLAIGKKGQNVRLAAKLLGWKIDIKSEEEKRQEVEQQMSALTSQTATPIEQVHRTGRRHHREAGAAGITTVEALADMTPEQLEAIEGIGPKTVEKISLAVNNYFATWMVEKVRLLKPRAKLQEVAAEEATGELAAEDAPVEERGFEEARRRSGSDAKPVAEDAAAQTEGDGRKTPPPNRKE